MAQPKITDADIAGMDDLFGPPPPPPPRRSPLRDLNPSAGAQPLFPNNAPNPPPAPSVAKPPPPREAARRKFSPTAADVADADAALKKMEAELAATLKAPPPPPAPASSPQRGKLRRSYASARDAARRARNGQRPALLMRPEPTVRPSLGDRDPGPVWPLLLAPPDPVEEEPPRKKRKKSKQRKGDAPSSLADHANGIDSLGRENVQLSDAALFIECELGTAYNPGPAVDGAKELLAEKVPQACLGYPDYKKNRGAAMFRKGKAAQAFYKANGYWKIAVKNGHHANSSKAVFKFFKEVERA